MVHAQADRPLARSFWPLPGGRGHFCETLADFILAADGNPSWDEYITRLGQRIPQLTSDKAARQYAGVVRTLGFIGSNAAGVSATRSGKQFLSSRDVKLVRDALFDNIGGMRELVDLLREQPRRIGLLLEPMGEAGFEWKTHSQLRYRLQWLEEVGVVSSEGRARPVYSVAGPRPRRKRAQ